MRELDITDRFINFVDIKISHNTPFETILRDIALQGWFESCNDWDKAVHIIQLSSEAGQLYKDKLRQFYFYIRY